MMAWRKQLPPPHIEPHEWYRNYHPEAWDEPDAHEQAMMNGCSGRRCWPHSPPSRWPDWPQWLHEAHSRRRWQEARYGYLQDHPDLSAQEFRELVEGYHARHRERQAGNR
jgi:hypothetical protein